MTLEYYNNKIKELQSELKYDKRRIMRRAHYIAKKSILGYKNFGDILRLVYEKAREHRESILCEIDSIYASIRSKYEIPIPSGLWTELIELDMQKAYLKGGKIN